MVLLVNTNIYNTSVSNSQTSINTSSNTKSKLAVDVYGISSKLNSYCLVLDTSSYSWKRRTRLDSDEVNSNKISKFERGRVIEKYSAYCQ